MEIKDLKVGEYYYLKEGNNRFIIKFSKLQGNSIVATNIKIERGNHFYVDGWFSSNENCKIATATPEEKHQLDESIKANKFVSYDEAMKTFNKSLVGRYFKALENNIACSYTIKGNIYRVKSLSANGGVKFFTEKYPEFTLAIDPINFHLIEFLPEDYSPKQENKFEIGKYYFFNWKAFNNKEVYCKVSDLDNIQIVVSWNCRRENSFWKQYTLDGFLKEEMLNVKEISINEVQQYLPDGHVDKVSNSIPKYVECIKYTANANEYTVGKIYKIENGSVRTNRGYLGDKKLPLNLKNHYGNSDFKSSTKEAYETQFKQQNIPMKEEEFKVGDWLYYDGTAINTGTGYWEKGTIGRFVKKEKGNIYLDSIIGKTMKQGSNSDYAFRRCKLEEIPTENLTNDELLSIAKQYFKIGIVAKAMYSINNNYTIISDNFYWNNGVEGVCLTVKVKEVVNSDNDVIAIYTKKSGFTQIISSPIENKEEKQIVLDVKPTPFEFKEETFVLPELWFCKIDESSIHIFNNWKLNKVYKAPISKAGKFIVENGGVYSSQYWNDKRKEITFNQFKEYVLGEKPVKMEGLYNVMAKQYPTISKECISNKIIIPKVVKKKPNLEINIGNAKFVNVVIPKSDIQKK